MNEYHPIDDIASVLSILSEISVWGGLTDGQQGEIFQRLEAGTFRRGEYIFHEGDQPSHIYILKKGKIEIVTSDGEVSVCKESVQVGGCFGIVALLAVQTYTASALATEDSEVMVLSREALLSLYKEDTPLFALLMMNIAREIARKLTTTDEVLLHYVHELKDGQSSKLV
jgi:CRP/FNR family transcriptional regulator, cyclic AMP receptor protein